jgi:phosphoribosylcarboxyaminoimidazole (NCAIR) mutase
MLEIAESNSKTSNNNIRLAAAMLAINITRLVAAALIIPVIATPLKLTIIAPFKCNAYKAIRGCAASSAN